MGDNAGTENSTPLSANIKVQRNRIAVQVGAAFVAVPYFIKPATNADVEVRVEIIVDTQSGIQVKRVDGVRFQVILIVIIVGSVGYIKAIVAHAACDARFTAGGMNQVRRLIKPDIAAKKMMDGINTVPAQDIVMVGGIHKAEVERQVELIVPASATHLEAY